MGIGCSRCGCSDSRTNSLAPSERPGRLTAANSIHSRTSYEQDRQEALRMLRDEFKRRPTVFLISQIMMSVQFFKNFDRDRLRIFQLKEEKEEELNRALQKDKKSAAYLGSPYEVIGEVMAYCRRDGEEPCLGHDLEYLIMHDSIAVKTPSDDLSPEEEGRTYQFLMHKCRNQGYTRLRQTGRIPAPTSRRSRRSARQSRDWSSHQSPLNESETEPDGATSSAPERSPSPSGARPQSSPASIGRRGGKSQVASDRVSSPSAARPHSSPAERTGGKTEPAARTDAPNGARERTSGPNSGSGAPGAVTTRTPKRTHGPDSPADSDEHSSSSINSGKGAKQAAVEPNANHQGEGKKFLENLKRKMNGDTKARIDLSEEEQTEEEGKPDKPAKPDRPMLTVTDETGMDRRMSATSASTDSAHQPTSATQQEGKSHQGDQGPTSNGLMTPDGHAAVDGGSMMAGPYYHGPGTPTQGQKVVKDPIAHFPGHVPPHVPRGHYPPQMIGAGPYPVPTAMMGYPQPGQVNPQPFLVHPAAPHFVQFQPGMNPYQQFPGAYPMSPPPAGWPHEPTSPGEHYPYLPGVPLANQNPAVGYGMPGFPGQPVPPGYIGAPYPYMYPAPVPTGHQLNTITEGRPNGKSRKPGGEAKSKSTHLMPPGQHEGRRKSRAKSAISLLPPIDSRRQSTSSNASRFSFMESTTTDEETDMPGLVPHHCFRKMRMRVDAGDDDDEDIWREPHYETHRFLSSERFLGTFADRFGELVSLMKRDAWLQHGGRGHLSGAVVQCREVLRSGLRTTARITATLQVSSWPSEQAFEWALRRRPELLDVRRRMRYVWPPQRVVQTILQEVGCNLVPMSSGQGEPNELEWEIAFQQAEIKLISSLDLVHVHCWAVAKMFFTHFLSEFGCLQERHIRHLMFWQFENNFRDWHLEGLGTTFVGLLNSLKESVRERRLEHYFVRKRNLLQNADTGNLVSAQEKIQRVMENLLPNVIILMNRLQVRNDAFPTLDWQNLYDTLRMSTTEIMKKIIPEFDIPDDENQYGSRDSLSFNPTEHITDDVDDDGFNYTRRQKIEQSYRIWLREQKKQQNNRRRQQQNRSVLRPGKPMPEFAGPHDKLNTLGDGFQPRVEMVLSLFIRHFSAMAERLLEHKSIDTALAYIDHTLNLCDLLTEQDASQTADELREKVLELQAAAIAELPAPGEEVEQVDPDLLQMASGAGGTSAKQDNWTVGPEKGHATRRDFNREAAAAVAGDMAEWQARGGARPETEGRDEPDTTDGGNLFSGPALFGEMRVNPAFVEDHPKDDDAEDEDAVESAVKLRTSRGEADGSEDMDDDLRGPAVGRSRSGSRGSSSQVIDEGEEEDEEEDVGDEDEENDGTEDESEENEEDEDSEDTKM